ncbi:uncharacterized protein LOC117088597 [Trachypithecus francoisi]|uniref:uncharacterized protein LOC117088597 n=1 Tax=Trachypithecus francoisi TaxID=54180 RepID=UPI00141B9C0C|nr:uncharacterized protein LOC117088597 [Trachypithecus francoisi]
MVARGARTERGPGPRAAQLSAARGLRRASGAGPGFGPRCRPRCRPRCAVLRVRLLICSAAATAAARSQDRFRSFGLLHCPGRYETLLSPLPFPFPFSRWLLLSGCRAGGVCPCLCVHPRPSTPSLALPQISGLTSRPLIRLFPASLPRVANRLGALRARPPTPADSARRAGRGRGGSPSAASPCPPSPARAGRGSERRGDWQPRTPESVAWRPHRVEFVFGQKSGLRASQETRTGGLQSSPERAAAPHRPPGTWRPFLGPEKRRGNSGVNFANFALGAGEAAGRNRATAAAGRDAQDGPRARARHRERVRMPKVGREGGGLLAPPLRPCASCDPAHFPASLSGPRGAAP